MDIDRIQLERLDTTGTFPVGHVVDRPEVAGQVPADLLEDARATFASYREALTRIRVDPYEGDLPQDPSYLSWTLAAFAPLPLHERQAFWRPRTPVNGFRWSPICCGPKCAR